MAGESELDDLHYEADDLVDYFTGEMSDDEAAALERHLGKCHACREDAGRASQKLAAWHAWSPEAHQQAYLRHRLVPVLTAARADRLKQWVETCGAQAEAAVRLVVGGMPSMFDVLGRPAPRYQFALAGAGVRTRGAVRKRGPVAGRAAVKVVGSKLHVELPAGSGPAPLVWLIDLAAESPAGFEVRTMQAEGDRYRATLPAPSGEYLLVLEQPAR
jgi:anti-sigma factor RsiW